MRMAELVMGLVMGIFSIYLMWKSAELPIGWIAGEGPGGGAWPFWLAAGMLCSCVAIIIRWAKHITPESQSDSPFMDRRSLKLFLLNAVAITAMIGLFHIVGAPGMSAGAKSYYQGLFKKVFDSSEWQGYMKKKSLQGGFLTGDALMNYWMREKAVQKAILQKMGVLK